MKLELLTDIDMVLMVEKEIRGGICQTIHRNDKANNKCMNKYDKSIMSSYLMYLDANSLYGWVMSQKLPVNGFNWIKKLSKFNKGYFLEVDVEYPKKLFNLHKDLSFLPEREKIGNCKKLICSIRDKEKYVVHRRALKQTLNHRLILKKSTQSNSIKSKSMVETIH